MSRTILSCSGKMLLCIFFWRGGGRGRVTPFSLSCKVTVNPHNPAVLLFSPTLECTLSTEVNLYIGSNKLKQNHFPSSTSSTSKHAVCRNAAPAGEPSHDREKLPLPLLNYPLFSFLLLQDYLVFLLFLLFPPTPQPLEMLAADFQGPSSLQL